MSPHIAPAAHVADCGALLQSAGFTLPTVDVDTITVSQIGRQKGGGPSTTRREGRKAGRQAGMAEGGLADRRDATVGVYQVNYPDALTLMEHLQAMGESSAVLGRRAHVSRDTFLAAAAIYQGEGGGC